MKVVHQNLPNDTNPSIQAETHVFDNGIHHLMLHNVRTRSTTVSLGRDELVALVTFLAAQDLSLILNAARFQALGRPKGKDKS